MIVSRIFFVLVLVGGGAVVSECGSAHAFSTRRPRRRQTQRDGVPQKQQQQQQQDPEFVDIVVIGGGLVGAATAVALSERGIQSVRVYEQATTVRRIGAAIGLYPNGLAALSYISPSMRRHVQERSIPSRYFERRDADNQLVRVTDVFQRQAVSPVYFPWYALQQAFVQALPTNVVEFGHAFHSYRVLDHGVVQVTLFSTADSSCTTTVVCRVLIGADGIHSAVRQQLQNRPTTNPWYDIMAKSCTVPSCRRRIVFVHHRRVRKYPIKARIRVNPFRYDKPLRMVS